MADAPDQQLLSYFVSEKPPILVVSLAGKLVGESEPVLKKCQDDIVRRASSYIILNLQEVKSANMAAVSDFVKLQVAARQKGFLRLCSLDRAVGELLFQRGAIRGDEVVEDLKSALASLPLSTATGT
jgi:anti-anti-sigma regulatory factor